MPSPLHLGNRRLDRKPVTVHTDIKNVLECLCDRYTGSTRLTDQMNKIQLLLFY